jgi:YHS domain-containing protein
MGSFFIEFFEFLILALFLRGMARSLSSIFRSGLFNARPPKAAAAPTSPPPAPKSRETARDPVCGMFVSTELSQRLKRGNDTLHFCSLKCLEKYLQEVEHVAP